MSRNQERYGSRSRALAGHYGSSPSMMSSVLGGGGGGSQYSHSPYSSGGYSSGAGAYSSNSYSPNKYRNYNPYSAGFGRAGLGIYGGTTSGYGSVYLGGTTLGSLNLMTPVLKKLDKKLLASKINFKPKPVPPAPVRPVEPAVSADVAEVAPVPPVRPERRKRAAQLQKEKSRSLSALDSVGSLHDRSLSLNSLASDGYCSGSETSERARTDAGAGEEGARDYKALYEASQAEVRRLRALLHTSEQQLRDVRATITCLTQNQSQSSMRLFERQNQSSMSELEKRERRAMERKLSEMEEELKYQQALQAENQRLKDENGALIRVISKLSK